MAIDFFGKGIDKKPDNKLGWFSQSIIPVFDKSDIPDKFKQDFLGFETGGEQTISPIKIYESGGSSEKLITPWTATSINLNNFQLEMLWGLNEGKKPGEEIPSYNSIYNDSSYVVGSTPEIAGASVPDSLKGSKKFIVKEIYIGSSAEYMLRSRQKRILGLGSDILGFALFNVFWGLSLIDNVLSAVAQTFFEQLDPFKYGVYYFVGHLEEAPSVQTSPMEMQNISSVAISLPYAKKPSIYAATRDPDNFAQAIISTKEAGKVEVGSPPGTPTIRVKFIFDNGIEKYAEIVSIEDNSTTQTATQTTTQTTTQPASQGFTQAANQAATQAASQGFNQAASQGAIQPVNNQGATQATTQGFAVNTQQAVNAQSLNANRFVR